jgi:hypothetical protein
VTELNVQAKGIKQKRVFNDLAYFYAARNGIQDIMHDGLEGVCAYDLPLICQTPIRRKYFDLTTLNHRIQTSEYGYHEKSNKMPVVVSLDTEMWTFDACQLWSGIRVLSLTVGDLVSDEQDDVWQMYLLLRNILDIIFCPAVHKAQLHLLSTTISEYLQKRVELFEDNPLKNKHHHLIHYPNLIRKVGPLVRFWCMRLESKHQRSKRLLRISRNFKNILQTLAVRHHYAVAFRLLSCNNHSEVTAGNRDTSKLTNLDYGREISQSIGCSSLETELFHANWAEVCGILYKPDCYILADVSDKVPVFVHVLYIVALGDGRRIWLCGTKLSTKFFSTHYHSWVVERQKDQNIVCINPLELVAYPLPVMVNSISGKDQNGDKIELSIIALCYHV